MWIFKDVANNPGHFQDMNVPLLDVRIIWQKNEIYDLFELSNTKNEWKEQVSTFENTIKNLDLTRMACLIWTLYNSFLEIKYSKNFKYVFETIYEKHPETKVLLNTLHTSLYNNIDDRELKKILDYIEI